VCWLKIAPNSLFPELLLRDWFRRKIQGGGAGLPPRGETELFAVAGSKICLEVLLACYEFRVWGYGKFQKIRIKPGRPLKKGKASKHSQTG